MLRPKSDIIFDDFEDSSRLQRGLGGTDFAFGSEIGIGNRKLEKNRRTKNQKFDDRKNALSDIICPFSGSTVDAVLNPGR